MYGKLFFLPLFILFTLLLQTKDTHAADDPYDSITYARTWFYGHSLVHNGKHLNLRKVARSYKDNRQVQLLYKQILKRKVLLGVMAVPCGMMLGLGITEIIYKGAFGGAGALGLAGAGLGFYGMYLYDLQDKQDLQRLANILP